MHTTLQMNKRDIGMRFTLCLLCERYFRCQIGDIQINMSSGVLHLLNISLLSFRQAYVSFGSHELNSCTGSQKIIEDLLHILTFTLLKVLESVCGTFL